MKSRKVRLSGWGYALPEKTVVFNGQTRYRVERAADMLELVQRAVTHSLDKAGIHAEDLDCIVCGTATPLQAIPCNAALVHERLTNAFGLKGWNIPAMDINTTCTSFLSALDVVSCMIEFGKYRTVLIISGDRASAALNPEQKESYELFSDSATAMVVTACEVGEPSEILYAGQKTWSEGAHDTEIRGGGGLLPSFDMTCENRADYYFDMKGPRILKLSAKVLPGFLAQGLLEAAIRREDISLVIPHQASKALQVIMPRLGFPEGSYVDYVRDYGNMISASVPFALCKAIEEGRVHRGDLLLLMGTAAGLSANMVILRF